MRRDVVRPLRWPAWIVEQVWILLPLEQRFGVGAEWQASTKLNVQFSYELAYSGDLPVNQNRGPLAGAVVGQFPSSYLNFFQVSFIWGS